LSLAAYPIDHHVTEHASAGGTDQVFAFGGVLGSGYMQAGGAIAAYFTGRLTNHSTTVRVGADLIRVQVLAGVLTHGAKLAARRDRPGGVPGHPPATYAFPSAHVSATFGTVTTLWRHFGWKAGIPASLVGVYIGGSRLQQNQHFLSDVIFGAALGVASGRTITVGHGVPALVAVPAVARGSAAVMFVLARR
jgi:membrane-associated phospholipid phosphatase